MAHIFRKWTPPCDRCGEHTTSPRVTCCSCGRSLGRTCRCAEKWTEGGPARYFCSNNLGPSLPEDCRKEKEFIKRNIEDCSAAFLKKMRHLNGGNWP